MVLMPLGIDPGTYISILGLLAAYKFNLFIVVGEASSSLIRSQTVSSSPVACLLLREDKRGVMIL